MFRKLMAKLVVLVSLLIFLAVSGVAVLIYFNTVHRIESLLGARALGIARTAAAMIDGEKHKALLENIAEAGNMPEMAQLRAQLQEIKKSNKLQTDVYTYIDGYWLPDPQIIFVGTSGDAAFEIRGQKKEPYMEKALKEGSDGFSDVFTTVNGEWITGYSAIRAKDGTVSGAFEVALETSKEVAEARSALIRTITSSAAFALLFGMIATVFVSLSITSPIKSLTAAAQLMAKGDLSARAQPKGKDEIGQLGNHFNEMASNLEKSYRELENYSKNLEKMVAARTAEVVAGKKKIQKILDHIEQGILTFDASMKLESEFSAFLGRFYGVEQNAIAGSDVLKLVFGEKSNISANDMNQISESLSSIVQEDSLNWDANAHHLVKEAIITVCGEDRIIALDWTPMINADEIVERMMLSVRDLTKQRGLELEVAKQKAQGEKTMSVIAQLIKQQRPIVRDYLKDSTMRLARAIAESKGGADAEKMFVELHTVKGVGRALNITGIMNICHEAEHLTQQKRAGETVDSEHLTTVLNEVAAEIKETNRIFSEVLGGNEGESGGKDSDQGTPSLTSAVGQMVGILQSALVEGGCTLAAVECHDGALRWRPDMFGDVSSILTHALNNSVDHGYVFPTKRGDSPRHAHLRVEAKHVGDLVKLSVSDDGAGIDIDKVVATAKARGIAVVSGRELDSLFAGGVSTAEAVTMSSGRGVGLRAIRDIAERLGGNATILRNQTVGARIEVDFPASNVLQDGAKTPLLKTVS